jgi:CBS domain containing-hemolysin-like protein
MKLIFNLRLVCLDKEALTSEARKLMHSKKMTHLPIVNEYNEIISILSQHDLLNSDCYQDFPADYFASRPVHYLSLQSTLSDIAMKMLEEKISSVVLSDQFGYAVGLMTRDDLLYQLAEVARNHEHNILAGTNEFMQKLSNIGI